MELKNKEWLDIIGRIADYHGDPLIILDDSFEIIFTNQKAISTFSIDDFNISLEQIFEKDTTRNLSDSIGIALNTNKKKTLSDYSVELKNGNTITYNISLELLHTEDSINIVLLFNNVSTINSNDLLKKIKLLSAKNLTLDRKLNLNNFINEIQKHLPFTIISLKNIQNFIDKHDFPIWIKNLDKKLICINSTYAHNLGIENIFAAGKKHEAFLPPQQKVIYNLLDQYIIENKQQIILEGFSTKTSKKEYFQSIIQIPLFDNLSNICAVIGLIIDNKLDYYKFWGAENYFDEYLNHFPNSVALINSDGIFMRYNSKFGKLLNLSETEVINKKIEDVFPFFVTQNFNTFIKNNLSEEYFNYTKDFTPTDSSNYYYKIYLTKNTELEKRTANVLMILEKQSNEIIYEDELQNILMNRGKMFDILIQKNPEPIFIYDKENLRFLEVNDAAVKLYGYSKDEFLQMDLTDLYAPEDIQTLLDSFGDEASESRFSKPFRHRKKDGTNVLVEISKTSFNFNDREAHFNIVKDITYSIETEKQNQMLKAIFAETDLMVFSTDASGFITFASTKVFQKLAYNNDEILQSSFASLVVDDDRAIINTSIFQSHLKDSVVLETKFKTSDDKNIDAEITATPILDFDGEIDSFTIVAKTIFIPDVINEPKEVIKEIIKEVVVEKPAAAENKIKIPDANFLSGMFHEILTPINVIIGFSQELISSTENPTEEQLEASEIINQNRIKMMDTMNSVVEYSDIMQNKSQLKIEDINITEIIEKLDNNIQDISGINDIQFAYGKISSSLKFKTDRQKFESFILSLIKVVSRLSKDKKIYFSAFPIDNDSFVIGISDQYGNPSEYVANVLEQVFVNDRDPKDFGLPKLTSYLSKTLLSFLGGNFYKASSDSMRRETGFLFPVVFSATEQKYFKSLEQSSSSTEEIKTEKIVEEEFDKTNKETSDPQLEYKEDDVDISLDDTTEEDVVDNYSDIFKPDTPIAQEIVSEVTDEKQTEEEYFKSISDEDTSLDDAENTDLSETQLNTSSGTELNSKENISDEIVQEIDSEITEEQEAIVPQSLDLAKLSCLYIEDQIDSQILFKVQMKGLNEVKFAVSFEEAQLLLLNHQFDFIVIDINLQGEYNGLDALKIIKTMPAFSSIPIIAVTAYVLPGDKEKFIAAGFDDFISKPIFKEKMMESLEKVFLSK